MRSREAAIEGTRAIDMFLLFQLGIGVNRLLTRDAEIPAGWRRRLDLLLGTADWYDEFYRFEKETTLFEEAAERVVKASTATIGRYFTDRLRSIFAGVAEQPRVLKNKLDVRFISFASLRAIQGAPGSLWASPTIY
jgi:hypothetical protein